MTKVLTMMTSLIVATAAGPTATTAAQDTSEIILDRNQDGYISLSEAGVDEALYENFAKLDVNGDGLLDKEELKSRPVPRDPSEQQNIE